MARYQMDDGTVVDTDNASQMWKEDTYWDGNNTCGVHTRSQWVHQELYRSRRGRYYIETCSQWQGSQPHAEWISNHGAARWLLINNDEIPEELQEFADEVIE